MADETPQETQVAEAPPERLEDRLTAAVDAAEKAEAPAQPTVDGLPVEPGPNAAPTPQAESGWQSVRDYAKAQGVELPYDDDAAALNDLIRARQQLAERNYYSDLGQRIAPHAAQVQEFLKQRQAPQQEPPAWAPPPFKKEWLGQVERDEASGQLRVKPGFDPAVAERVQAYADWRDRFLDNPEQVVAPLIEQRANQLIEQKFAEHQQQQLAERLVQQNASWLYQRDQSGRALLDPRTGKPAFSPAGVVYAQEARRVYDSGVRDVAQMDYYARLAAENAALRGHLQQQKAPAVPAPGQPAAAPARPNVGGQAGRPSVGGPPAVPVSRQGLSLREKLQAALSGAPEDISL